MATPQQSEQPRSAPALSAKRAAPSPLPQPKSAVADFGHFVGWPNPRYSEVRLGRGRGWGSEEAAKWCHNSPPPRPSPTRREGEEPALPSEPAPPSEGGLASSPTAPTRGFSFKRRLKRLVSTSRIMPKSSPG